MENIRSAAKKGDGELENILRDIGLMIVGIVELGVLIFGINWGYSLLVNELQSPGSVSLSATILYISLFYFIVTSLDNHIKVRLKEEREEEREE